MTTPGEKLLSHIHKKPDSSMQPVVSSNIEAVGHDPETNKLRIQFKNGGLYEYEGFTEEEMTVFGAADSVGRYYSANIRKQYESRKICGICYGAIDEGTKGNFCGGDSCGMDRSDAG